MATAADDPDLPLVRALQAGDESALGELMGRHEAALFRFLFRYLRNATDAADLTQETFVRAYFKIGQFRPGVKFSVWLYRIALNLFRDHARSPAARRGAMTNELPGEGAHTARGTPAELATDSRNPAAALEDKEQVRALENAIERLPPDLKQAFVLAVLEGFSQKECAEMLEVSPKAVETRVYRARKLLAAALRPVSP